jgi:3-methyladenine DNA glycosylase AlkC
MADFPTFEAELGYAVARGWTNLTMADAAILARTTDDAEAKRMAIAVRRSAAAWHHIREQLALRISELTSANARARLPWNVLMAQAHEVNRTRTLDEAEVTAIVETAVYENLPDRRRKRGA